MPETPVTSPLLMDRSEPLGNSLDEYGRRAAHAKVSGQILIKGASTAGSVTLVSVTNAAWVALPATPLANRNTVLIQNQATSATIVVNFSNTAPATSGIRIGPGGALEIMVSNGIAIYGRNTAAGPAVTIGVMELA